MKKYIHFLTLSCLLIHQSFSAQVSSDKTTFRLNTAPVLTIENLLFSDENQNKIADLNEKCHVNLTVKNSGKSTAKSVNIQMNPLSEMKGIFSVRIFFLGNINPGESKEINIPLTIITPEPMSAISIEFVAIEENKYQSKPFYYSLPLKISEQITKISWTNPLLPELKVHEEMFKLKACLDTREPVEKLELLINNKLIPLKDGMKLTKGGNCESSFEHNIKLNKGNNQIQIFAYSKSGMFKSEIRNIQYSEIIYENRTALIIGNSKYDEAPLKNPANDAKEMAKTLRDLNFDVIDIIDGDLSSIRQAIRDFHTRLTDRKGVGLFYYAGHGVQLKGENYIMPVKHDIQQEFEIPDRAVRVNSILDAMESTGTRMNIVILDACRNNPFASSSRSINRGLAQVYAEGTGSIISYATAPGSVASDGEGDNGLYTQELLKAIKTPGLEIGMIFRNVLTNVKRLSSGKQLPWTTSSIEGEFYFIK
jgi:hypothetical protein